jgi:hypothetical protein
VCVRSDQKVDGASLRAGSRLKWISTDGDKVVGALPTDQKVTLPAAEWMRVTLGDAVRLPFDGRMPAPADPSWKP